MRHLEEYLYQYRNASTSITKARKSLGYNGVAAPQQSQSSMTFLRHTLNTTYNDIIHKVPPLKRKIDDVTIGLRLFLTTGLMAWVEEGHPFLAELSKQLLSQQTLQHNSHKVSIDCAVAVVDQLPRLADKRSLSPVVGLTDLPYGYGGSSEGFCYHVSSGPLRDKEVPPWNGEEAISSPSQYIECRPSDEIQGSWSVALQPANTLFSNGQLATLFRTKVELVPETTEIRLSPRTKLRAICVTAPDINKEQILSIPLIPITSPRCVSGSMGNVISQIIVPGSQQTEVPASTELEPAVANFLSQHDLTSTQIFAYIEHRDEKPNTSEAKHSGENPRATAPSHGDWQKAFNTGVLRKVTGGGGGWGKKRGLLSFDPSTTIDNVSDSPFPSGIDVVDKRRISQIATPGDTLQFFGTPSWPPTTETSKDAFGAHSLGSCLGYPLETDEASKLVSTILKFGKIPPSSDIVKYSENPKPINDWTVIPNFFGMLSEGNVSIYSRSSKGSGSYLQCTEAQDAKYRSTRLNVPYATLTNIQESKKLADATDKGGED